MQQVRIICNKLRLMCNKLCIMYNYLPVYNTYSCRSRSKKAKPSTAAPAAATIAETMLAAVLNGTDIEKKVLLCVRNIKLQLLSIHGSVRACMDERQCLSSCACACNYYYAYDGCNCCCYCAFDTIYDRRFGSGGCASEKQHIRIRGLRRHPERFPGDCNDIRRRFTHDLEQARERQSDW